MMVKYFPGPVTGPLAPYVAGFGEVLAAHGYARSTSQQTVSLVGRLSRWLDIHRLGTSALTDEVLRSFLDDLAAENRWQHPTPASFVLFLGYLRDRGLAPMPEPQPGSGSPGRIIQDRFEQYLVHERGLSASTIRHYVGAADAFMDWLTDRSTTLQTMSGADVITFITDLYAVQSAGSVKYMITGLRSFLAWVFLDGLSRRAFAGAVPSAAGHDANLPQGLTPRELNALLASCDRGTVTGRRDFAILVLMGRLGLRSQEVASLRLHDVNWRAGDMVLMGKGHSQEKLPLPSDVGAALADYLSNGRPASAGDSLFMKVHAPLGGLASAGVSEVVLAAGKRAGLEGIHAHRLRHTAATQLLRAGGSLAEVGQVLRHRSPVSTALYANSRELHQTGSTVLAFR